MLRHSSPDSPERWGIEHQECSSNEQICLNDIMSGCFVPFCSRSWLRDLVFQHCQGIMGRYGKLGIFGRPSCGGLLTSCLPWQWREGLTNRVSMLRMAGLSPWWFVLLYCFLGVLAMTTAKSLSLEKKGLGTSHAVSELSYIISSLAL